MVVRRGVHHCLAADVLGSPIKGSFGHESCQDLFDHLAFHIGENESFLLAPFPQLACAVSSRGALSAGGLSSVGKTGDRMSGIHETEHLSRGTRCCPAHCPAQEG